MGSENINGIKPKYNMFQNSGFLIKLAWRLKKSVLFICLFSAGVSVLISLTGLFITPVIIGRIETAAPLNSLIFSIFIFSFLLIAAHAAAAYIDAIKRDGWQFLFVHIVAMSSEKYGFTINTKMKFPPLLKPISIWSGT